MDSTDSFLLSLGKPGRFQMIVFFCLWSNTYPVAFNNFVMVFYGIIPNHHCKIPQNSTLNETIPLNYQTNPPKFSKCTEYLNPANQSFGTTSCSSGWEYDAKMQERSIVSKWDLVCDRRWLLTFGISIYFVGVMLAGPCGGFLADRFGRQPLILASIYGQAVLGIGVAFIDNYIVFIVVRFFQAILMQCLQGASFTLVMEMTQTKSRAAASAMYSLSWTSALIILSLVAWGLDKWWQVQLVISLPSIISFFYFWFTPESMRWLIAHYRVDRAEQLAKKISKFNKIKSDQDFRSQIQKLCLDCATRNKGKPNDAKYTVADLVHTPQIRKYTFILGFIWFTAALVTYGISYNLSSLASNIYLSLVISGCIELPIRGCSYLILNKFGRRQPIILGLACSGVSCIAVPIIVHFAGDSSSSTIASTSVAIIGKAFMGLVYALIPIYTVELYPTVIRTFGQGSGIFFTRLAGIIAPQLGLLGLFWKPMPFFICGICGVIAGLLTILLPDTNHIPMPDMIEDVEARFRKPTERQHLVPKDQISTEDAFENSNTDNSLAVIGNGIVKSIQPDLEPSTKDASINTEISLNPGLQNPAFINDEIAKSSIEVDKPQENKSEQQDQMVEQKQRKKEQFQKKQDQMELEPYHKTQLLEQSVQEQNKPKEIQTMNENQSSIPTVSSLNSIPSPDDNEVAREISHL